VHLEALKHLFEREIKYGTDELQNAVQPPLPFWSASEAGKRQAHLRAETFKTNGTERGKTGAIHVYFSHLEAMRADGQQSEQNLSHFLWTSVKYESNVRDGPESSSFNRDEQPIRIAC
jgi:hypothetical protein